MKRTVFWVDDFKGNAKGGIFFRSFDLNKFIREAVEPKHGRVVGLAFEDNNVEIIVEDQP